MSEHEIVLTAAAYGEAYVRCVTCRQGLYVVVAGNERPLEDMLETVSRHLRMPVLPAPKAEPTCLCGGTTHDYDPGHCDPF